MTYTCRSARPKSARALPVPRSTLFRTEQCCHCFLHIKSARFKSNFATQSCSISLKFGWFSGRNCWGRYGRAGFHPSGKTFTCHVVVCSGITPVSLAFNKPNTSVTRYLLISFFIRCLLLADPWDIIFLSKGNCCAWLAFSTKYSCYAGCLHRLHQFCPRLINVCCSHQLLIFLL